MCWWCDDVKKTSIFDEVKNRPKTAILSPFSRALKNVHFWPFFGCWRVLTILWRVTTNFDDEMMSTTCDDAVDDEKKLRRAKKLTKKRPSAEPYKNTKNGARHGRWEPRSGRVTRSVYDAIAWRWPCLMSFKRMWKPGNGTSSASVAMCEAFLDTCAAYSHDWLIPRVGLMKAGTCERSEVCAGITKVREDFFFWYEVAWRHTG
jgi:hypothetical protein